MTKIKDEYMLFSIGDYIVHKNYGVGEVVGIEEKTLSSKTTTYYVVETKDSTFWMPVVKADNERTRLIVPAKTIHNKVIEVLEDDPQEMSSNHKTRRKRIKDVNASGNIVIVAELVRDLTYRKAVKGRLAVLEDKDLEYLKNRLITEWITEWAKSVRKPKQKVTQKVERILQQHREEK
jgi:CarD family transcriptional regulator